MSPNTENRMNNPLHLVAKHQGLDVEAFTAFAKKHHEKLGAFEDFDGNWYVSNWHVDRLIAAFRDSQEFAEFKAQSAK